jgi:hypothetical protein
MLIKCAIYLINEELSQHVLRTETEVGSPQYDASNEISSFQMKMQPKGNILVENGEETYKFCSTTPQ